MGVDDHGLLVFAVINLGDSTTWAGTTRFGSGSAPSQPEHLATATLLADSFVRQHPDISRHGCSSSTAIPTTSVRDSTSRHASSDLAIASEEFSRMRRIYDVTEIVDRLKPYLLETSSTRVPKRSCTSILTSRSSFLSTTSSTRLSSRHRATTTRVRIPRDGLLIDEVSCCVPGQFQPRFIAVGRSGKVLALLVRADSAVAIVDPDAGTSPISDGDAVPALFDHIVLRDRGCNVAYWNLSRTRTRLGCKRRVDSQWDALRFFHYSGTIRPNRSVCHLPTTPRQGRPKRTIGLLTNEPSGLVAADAFIGQARPTASAEERTELGDTMDTPRLLERGQ